MTATRKQHSMKQTKGRVLYLAFELGWNEWKLAFATGPGDNPRLRSIGGRNTEAVLQEIAKAKIRFGLAADAVVQSCYEAGRRVGVGVLHVPPVLNTLNQKSARPLDKCSHAGSIYLT